MKITQFGPDGLPDVLGGWSTGVYSLNSNTGMVDGGLSSLNFVQLITANGSNELLRPVVNFAAGSNIILSLDAGPGNSVPSNTIRIHGLAGSTGVSGITSNGSNSLTGAVNLQAGTNIALGVSGSTITIINTGTSGGGGGGGSGAPLGILRYYRATDGIVATTTSATQADVDATNCSVTFTAPASGNVIVDVGCLVGTAGSVQVHYLGLREGTTNIVPRQGSGANPTTVMATRSFYLTGISAGSHTYKLAFSADQGAACTMTIYGGPQAGGYGPVEMTVWAA